MPKPDPAKERYWRAMIADSAASGLSRAEYCRQRGINVICLRNWIERLKQRDARVARAPSTRQKVSATSKNKGIERQIPTKAKHVAQASAMAGDRRRSIEFAEVRVVESDKVNTATLGQDSACSLEIIFRNGTKLRLASGCQLNLLSSVITLLENR